MLPPDPKKIVAALLVKGKGPGKPDEAEDDSSAALESAAQDVLDAIKKDSAKDLAEALCNLYDVHESSGSEDDEE